MFAYEGAQVAIDEHFARVLHGSVGVSGWEKRGDVVEPLFCAPSSGNLRSVETYVVVPGGALLHYEPVARRFVECARSSSPTPLAGALVFLRAQPARQIERYGPRGARYALLDLGHAAFAVMHAARALGVRARRIIGSNVAIALSPATEWQRWVASRPAFRRTAIARETATARSAIDAPAIEPIAGLEPVYRRRSAQAFSDEPIGEDDLEHAIGDVPLRRIHPRDDRVETTFACGAQPLAGEAAAVVALTTPLPEDDDAYVAAHVLAGMRAQQICMRATTRGIGARVLGGFFDDDAAETFGAPGAMVLSCVALGRASTVDDR